MSATTMPVMLLVTVLLSCAASLGISKLLSTTSSCRAAEFVALAVGYNIILTSASAKSVDPPGRRTPSAAAHHRR
ncbi:hypothetical protein E1264_03245 [Actinomadura sp. KC216]|uniref:hypothetical protein n=1 Tax=Actinomadura sp. KC216 TaxID=2530370 RepID=UPI00104E81C9|nr:hypothetical protein [Actinomadura sp. KC216]TDB91024.1 hypothetical protein E1264_03245 [Actinomadura sp. KC216]